MLVAVVGSVAFLIPVVLYVLLVLGFPYGEFGMGGKYKVMPIRMRFFGLQRLLDNIQKTTV